MVLQLLHPEFLSLLRVFPGTVLPMDRGRSAVDPEIRRGLLQTLVRARCLCEEPRGRCRADTLGHIAQAMLP